MKKFVSALIIVLVAVWIGFLRINDIKTAAYKFEASILKTFHLQPENNSSPHKITFKTNETGEDEKIGPVKKILCIYEDTKKYIQDGMDTYNDYQKEKEEKIDNIATDIFE